MPDGVKQELANPEFAMFVIDDVNCNANYCNGPEEALARGVKEGILEVIAVKVLILIYDPGNEATW